MAVNETGFIEKVNTVADNLEVITTAANLFDAPTIEALASVSSLDLVTVIEDLAKSNYLGNRKLDIDVRLNNLSTVTNVAYRQADLLFKDGSTLSIPFYTVPGDTGSGITEYTSHADIKNYIANDSGFISKIQNTELTVEPAIGGSPEVIRFRDSDGQSSNLDKVTLTYFSGSAVDTLPTYYWAKTTSSLQTVANRVSDIIKLGSDIDNIIALANLSDEIVALNAISPDITTVAGIEANVAAVATSIASINAIAIDLANIDAVADTIIPNLAEILLADTNAATATAKASEAGDSNLEAADWANQSEDSLTRSYSSGTPTNRAAGSYSALHHAAKASHFSDSASSSAASAVSSASSASSSELGALAYLNEITGLSATALSLVANSSATAMYDSGTGVLTLGIPSGPKGDTGDSFQVNASGPIAGRSAYDGAASGFSYLSLDESPTNIYFKKTDTNADWSTGVSFGKGDTGDTGIQGASILSGTGIPAGGLGLDEDLYIDDANGDFYSKAAGSWTLDSNFSSTINDVASSLINTYSSAYIESLIASHAHASDYEPVNSNIQSHISSNANPHGVNKTQVGLSSVDNTADAAKPVSILQQSALDLKLNTADIDLDQGASI